VTGREVVEESWDLVVGFVARSVRAIVRFRRYDGGLKL
jgi:hypothetical protein